MEITEKFDWFCKTTWSKSAYNTFRCLIGCSIGDFGTIYYFQITPHSLSVFLVMFIAIINEQYDFILMEVQEQGPVKALQSFLIPCSCVPVHFVCSTQF